MYKLRESQLLNCKFTGLNNYFKQIWPELLNIIEESLLYFSNCTCKQIYLHWIDHSTLVLSLQIKAKIQTALRRKVNNQGYKHNSKFVFYNSAKFTAANSQSLQQQSGKTHCCSQKQRAHNHDSATETIENLRTLAARERNSGRVSAVVRSFKAARGIRLVPVAAITNGKLLEKRKDMLNLHN